MIFKILKNPGIMALVFVIIGFCIPLTMPIMEPLAILCGIIFFLKQKMNEGKCE